MPPTTLLSPPLHLPCRGPFCKRNPLQLLGPFGVWFCVGHMTLVVATLGLGA